MIFTIPENVAYILKTLEENGFSSYVVGGCVRDYLLSTIPEDWDITTTATPAQVKMLFPKTIDTGLKHGTVTVLLEKEPFEVTTFRCDGDYVDSRRPETVSFTSSIEEDLARRDFTVNAMAYNPKHGLIDPFGGQEDLKEKVIRCVGEPDRRFGEDALRMLRAVRFAAQKDFTIEKNTLSSIQKNCFLVNHLSAERIISEITKILLSDRLDTFDILYETGILQIIMPEMVRCFETPQNIKWHIYDVGHHSLCAVSHMKKVPYLRFAMLMHDWGKPLVKGLNPDGSDNFRNHAKESVLLAEKFMNLYKFSNHDKDKILRLIQFHDREIVANKKCVKRAANAVGNDIFLDLLDVKRADAKAQNVTLTAERLSYYDELEKIYQECKENKEPFSVKNLDIDGHDLINLGFEGKKIGEILQKLLEHVLDHPEDNQKNVLINLIHK